MTYEEAMDTDTMVSRDEAIREIHAHGSSFIDFELAHGIGRRSYSSRSVLVWLGY